MAAFDLAVLLRPSGPDVSVPNPERLHCQGKRKREFLPVVALKLPDPERKSAAQLGKKRQARALMQPSIEPEDPEACAVVERGVLKSPAARDFHELDVDLDAFPWLGLFKELHLPGHSLAGPPQAGKAQIPKDPLDRPHRDPDIVNPPEPELGPLSPVTELSTRLAYELHDPRCYSPAAVARIPGHKTLYRTLTPPHPPAPDRPDTDAEPATRRRRTL